MHCILLMCSDKKQIVHSREQRHNPQTRSLNYILAKQTENYMKMKEMVKNNDFHIQIAIANVLYLQLV